MKKNLSRIIRTLGIVLALSLFLVGYANSLKAMALETEIKLNVSEVAIAKDENFRLRVYNVPATARIIYRSSDTSVAYADARGYITGISNGECKVTATIIDKGSPIDTLTCNVLIGPAAVSIKFTKNEIVLPVGNRKTIKTIVSPLNTVERPVFYSSDKSVASVTSIGRVRAKEIGVTTVFAFLKNDQQAECKVYVISDEDYEKYLEKGTLEGIVEGYIGTDFADDGEKGDEDQNNEIDGSEDEDPAEVNN